MQFNAKSTISKYLFYVRKHYVLALILLFSVIGASITGVVIPLYAKKFFDILAATGDKQALAGGLILILGQIALLELLRWGFWRSSGFANNAFQPRIIAELANHCFENIHRHSFSFFNSNFVGSLTKRVNYFTRAFESVADKLTWDIIPLIVDLSFVVTVLFFKNAILGWATLAWIVIFIIVNWTFATYKIKFDLKRSEAETKATAHLADTISNHSNVKLFVGYNREVKAFAAAQELVRSLRRFTWNLDNIFEAVQGFLAVGLEIGTFYLAIKLWKENKFTVGDFVLLQTYVIVIYDKIWNFGKLIRNIYADMADAAEMTKILDTPFEIIDAPVSTKLNIAKGTIEFTNVGFYYHETRKIFDKLNISIKPHEKVALVGPSGAGKSTIVKLILRLHEVSSGQICIDNQPINKVTLESLWQNISLVPQEPILFHRTLMENIRYGKPGASDDEVIKAAKLAHCHEFISGFPEQYKTFVGERGVKLSGGERQRVAIARAILRKAPILVLDEATSSLDSESEQLIQDALKALMANKTVIVIAHRLSTIMLMDRIIVFDQGKIVEEGTHNELLKLKTGLYSRLWNIQAGGFIS